MADRTNEEQVTQPLPHSWSIEHWPETVWPSTPTRARYVVRANRAELEQAGALSRVGKEMIILGEAFDRWLRSKAANVSNYEIAANRPENGALSALEHVNGK